MRGTGNTRVVAILGAAFLAVTGALSSWNVAREEGKDAAIRGNIDTILTQARYSAHASESGIGCASGVFDDPNIAAALDALRVAGNGVAARCVSSGQEYAVSAQRPRLGFFIPPTAYWCGDSSQRSCGSDTEPDAALPACACTP